MSNEAIYKIGDNALHTRVVEALTSRGVDRGQIGHPTNRVWIIEFVGLTFTDTGDTCTWHAIDMDLSVDGGLDTVAVVVAAHVTHAWVEQAPAGPQDAGDVAGDIQDGVALSRRWIRPTLNEPGHWSVMTSTYAVCKAHSTGERYIEHTAEWIVCTNPVDPHHADSIMWWTDEETTELSDDREVTDDLARQFSTSDTPALDWDGASERGAARW